MRFRFLSAMRWRASWIDIESPTIPWLSVIYVCQGQDIFIIIIITIIIIIIII